MAQTYTIDCYAAGNVGQTDLANMEANFEALRTTFEGAGAPANAIAGKQWFDSAQKLLKIRNEANDAWLGVLTGTTSLKMLVYRNTAEDGWAIDGGVEDKVIAVKGGATYTTGGATAGSWTLPDYTLLEADIPDHAHDETTDAGGKSSLNAYAGTTGTEGTSVLDTGGNNGAWLSGLIENASHTHTFTTASYGGDGAHNHGATYRPAAAVVTIQYPDI